MQCAFASECRADVIGLRSDSSFGKDRPGGGSLGILKRAPQAGQTVPEWLEKATHFSTSLQHQAAQKQKQVKNKAWRY